MQRGLPVSKTTDCHSDSKWGDAALLKQELENLQQIVATQKDSIAQLGRAVKDRDLQIATFQAGSSQKPRGGSSSSQDVAVLCNAHKQEKAALQETHEQEKAALQSAHKQEAGAFKAQAAQANMISLCKNSKWQKFTCTLRFQLQGWRFRSLLLCHHCFTDTYKHGRPTASAVRANAAHYAPQTSA